MRHRLSGLVAVLAVALWASGLGLLSTEVDSRSAAAAVEYHGNVKSHIFHGPSCRYYDCGNCTRVFKSRDGAIKAGYRPCKICKP